MQGEADVAATWADGGSPLADLKDIGASEPRSMLDVLRGLRTEAPERSGLKSEANADSHKSISPGLASLQSARLALKNALLTNSKLGSLKCASVDLLVSGGKAQIPPTATESVMAPPAELPERTSESGMAGSAALVAMALEASGEAETAQRRGQSFREACRGLSDSIRGANVVQQSPLHASHIVDRPSTRLFVADF
jgi:hypothetical protein